MPTPDEIHQQMDEGYAQQRPEHWKTQAELDQERRDRHLQVRLDRELAAKFHHYRNSRGLNVNQALNLIISHFFK